MHIQLGIWLWLSHDKREIYSYLKLEDITDNLPILRRFYVVTNSRYCYVRHDMAKSIYSIMNYLLPLFLESTSSMFCLLLNKVSSDPDGTPAFLVSLALS